MSKYKTLLRVALTATIALIMASCGPFSIRERSIILRSGNVMQVMVMPQDSAVLRARSVDLSGRELRSSELKTLAAKMLTTVQDPSQDGVGIAAPQVGINKRVICVMRYDKPGEPFEVYYNIYIDTLCGAVGIGPEGCLSVPGWYGLVPRHECAVVRYIDPASLAERIDTVHGYTAIIFQHEIDHLEGILYTDRADSLWRP
ncbi:MAG: peptide deformylase [Bacteroidales bacterium]|nr:peptide deformylase [Bacteroidales bacterium]